MFNVDFKECGRGSRNDWYRKEDRALSQPHWKARRGCHSAWLGKKKGAHWVIFAQFLATWIEKPTSGSMHHSWGSEQNPSLFPSDTYLWGAALLPVRYSPADVPWETRPAGLPLLEVQVWTLCTAGLKMTPPPLIPTGVPEGANFLLREGARSGRCVCVILFCSFVNLFSYS